MAITTTAAERSELARMAALTLHSKISDPAAHTAPARAAFMRKFELEVDPDGVLEADERERRARAALRAHMSRMRVKAMRKQARQPVVTTS